MENKTDKIERLVDGLFAAGFRLEPDGPRLLVRHRWPEAKLSDELAEEVKLHKPDLLRWARLDKALSAYMDAIDRICARWPWSYTNVPEELYNPPLELELIEAEFNEAYQRADEELEPALEAIARWEQAWYKWIEEQTR